MAERKRKRDSQDEQLPAKRRAHAFPETVKVNVLPETDDFVPVIATVPGLSLPPNTFFDAYKKHQTAPRLGSADASTLSTTDLLLHSSTHPKLDYIAREEESCTEGRLTKHYLGVYDPQTGELQLIQARKVVVRGTLRVAKPTNNANEEKDDSTSNDVSARNALGLAFGTKKSQKAIRSLVDNAITSPLKSRSSQSTETKRPLDPLASAVVASMAETSATISSRAQLQETVDENKPRPTPNLQAETPNEVYTIENLVGIEALRTLTVREWQEKIKANSDVQTRSRFVSARLRKVVRSGDVKRLKALRFLLTLLEWEACLTTSGFKSTKKLPAKAKVLSAVTDASDLLLDSLRRRFTLDGTLSKWHLDNLRTHICALALVIDNYAVDVFDIREDLRLENKQVAQYFRELGCKVAEVGETERKGMGITKEQGGSHKVARLVLPLDFPVVRQRARR